QLETEQQRLRQQLDLLPNATQETSAAMRRALQDQLGALDRLTDLATRTTERNNARAPEPRTPQAITSTPIQPQQPHVAEPRTQTVPPRSAEPTQTEAPRNLTNLTTTLARELSARQARLGRGDGVTTPPAATEPVDRWSLGDLLARASEDDNSASQRTPHARASAPDDDHVEAEPAPATSATEMLDLSALAGALDSATASVIWSRFRNGQRGFMVRSIYAPEARKRFDSVERRYRGEQAFRMNVDRFLVEFERGLHELDRKDPTRQSSDAQIITDTGRVYLVLAHAAGRLV
ncbi:MAG: hypothetical protein KDJ36_11385, partial [Hyphomicrobiaceae bacterium]|nr:hypothetical protein [Hyphomicrobiaceae bacterium]